MKNREAFTLVELMGVLVILALLLIVAVPSITQTLQNTKDNEQKDYNETICSAAKTYINTARKPDRTLLYSDLITGSVTSKDIKVVDLKANGVVPDNLKNPSGKSDADTKVTLKNNAGIIECVH